MKTQFFLAAGIALSFFLQAEESQKQENKSGPFETHVEQLLSRTLTYAKGHQAFKDVYFKLHEKEFINLVKHGQKPKALFIGCSDSRVDPSLITGLGPGDLFVIRTAGNFVPFLDEKLSWDGVAASLEYAVNVLGVKDIIVCGHSHCGAIKGLFMDLSDPKFTILKKWLKFGQEAKELTEKNCEEESKEECYAATEELSVVYQLEHLLSYPFVKKGVESNSLFLHGWYFRIETGEIYYYDPQKVEFVLLKEAD